MPEMDQHWVKRKMNRGLQYYCNTDPYQFYSTQGLIGLERSKDEAGPKIGEERFEVATHMLQIGWSCSASTWMSSGMAAAA